MMVMASTGVAALLWVVATLLIGGGLALVVSAAVTLGPRFRRWIRGVRYYRKQRREFERAHREYMRDTRALMRDWHHES